MQKLLVLLAGCGFYPHEILARRLHTFGNRLLVEVVRRAVARDQALPFTRDCLIRFAELPSWTGGFGVRLAISFRRRPVM